MNLTPLAILLTLLFAAVIALPLVNVGVLRSQTARRIGMGTLHATHFDVDQRPNRETRRGISRFLGRTMWVLADETGVVTLAQAKLNAQDNIDVQAIDEFRKSFFLENLPFHDAVSPAAGGGSTLTYGYTRVTTQPTAQTRALNTEYTPQEAEKTRYTVDLKVFGGAYEIDRVLAAVSAGAEVRFQQEQKAKAARALFHDLVINGDSAVDANAFDGLDKALTGSSTDVDGADSLAASIDISTPALRQSEGALFAELIDEALALMDGRPTVGLANGTLLRHMISIARRLEFLDYTTYVVPGPTGDDVTIQVPLFAGVPIVNAGDKPGSTNPIIPIESRDLDAGGANPAITGLTDLYFVRMALDGFHGVSLSGQPLVQTYPPDFTDPKAVHRGDLELVSAVALKASKAASRLSNIKVSA